MREDRNPATIESVLLSPQESESVENVPCLYNGWSEKPPSQGSLRYKSSWETELGTLANHYLWPPSHYSQ